MTAVPPRALKLYERALKSERAGKLAPAIKDYRAALKIAPGSPQIANNLGSCLSALGKPRDALAMFRRAASAAPNEPLIWSNLAGAYFDLGEAEAGAEAARKALALAPAFGPALIADAIGKEAAGDLDGALAAVEAAHGADPRNADALRRLARLRRIKDDQEGAAAAMEALAELRPLTTADNGLLYFLKRQICDWRGLDRLDAEFAAAVADGASPGPIGSPMRYFNRVGDRSLLRRIGEAHSARYAFASPKRPSHAPRRPGPIRLGYVSADLRNHPMMKLLLGILRRHDRDRIEPHLFALGADDASPPRREAEGLVAAVHRMSGATPETVVARIREAEIDVLVDLMGFTQSAMPEVFAARPAKTQVGFLGLPGTTGAPWLDWMIADATVAPPEHEPDYSERIVRVEPTYYPFDDVLPPIRRSGDRSEFGLPPEGAVFASFNQTYKLDPGRFGSWMTLLNRVEGSVLWLMVGAEERRGRLREAATAAGVAADRLIFAPRVDLETHYRRLAFVDVALDTWLYGGHTTTIDALWCGVPVVTRIGPTFSSRVAASILRAAALEELIAEDEDAYVDIAARLALNHDERAALSAAIHEKIEAGEAFDSTSYARSFEDAIERIHRGEGSGEAL